ncbi:MAG: DUF971 domain-containing protein [SAR202 cluster bacterium]|nr:DUF971 domain-containing protein [SAR202 cluster bacterium]
MSTSASVRTISLSPAAISVEWTDGHQSIYPPKYLRINCGCAECVEEWTNRKLLNPATVPAEIKAEDYMMVGRYAVQFLWSDAHFTGIYPFDVLRKLCPCDECKAQNAGTAAGAEAKK